MYVQIKRNHLLFDFLGLRHSLFCSKFFCCRVFFDQLQLLITSGELGENRAQVNVLSL
jgi:hypothetical protein